MKKIYEKPLIRKINIGIPNKVGDEFEIEETDSIDNVLVEKIIKEYGSPVFVFSERKIKETYDTATNAFNSRYPNVQFAWSYKTNYLNAICKLYHTMGSWAEVVSIFEYDKALSNGVPGDKIIFNGPEKTKEDLIKATKNNSYIHIDHNQELDTLLEVAKELNKKPRVAIRVNMDVGIYPLWDRFGFNYENGQAWEALEKIISSGLLNLVGLHSHIGTFMLSKKAYGVAATKLCELAKKLKNTYNHDLEYLDLGGGFASNNELKGVYYRIKDTLPTMDEYAEVITEAILKAKLGNIKLILETGRALIDDSGFLCGSVIANKKLSDGRKSVVMDFGINLMFTSFWYNHKITPVRKLGFQVEECVMFGPLCMNIDVVRPRITLPALLPGDQVVVHNMGAYNLTQSMQFIAYRPNVVLIDLKGDIHLIRKKENLEHIDRNDVVPKYLNSFKL